MASSSTSIPRTYDVFLSFRGQDTRRNFTDHLYSNLVAYGIHTFRDDEELEKGGDVASDLSKAIEESRIVLIIFSENYAQSTWCLNELVKIMECKNPTQKESTVIPVFYHVDPSDVRKQSGSFGDALARHGKDADEEKKEMIQKWRFALKTAANLSGCHIDAQRKESGVIEEIREAIIKRLGREPLHVGDNIVGMSFHMEQFRSLIKIELDEVRMIGIYGTGGIGKTTIGIALYNEFSSQFDGSSFLRVDGEKSKRGLLELQQKLLQDVLKGKRPEFHDIKEGINVIKRTLCFRRVLIILDDVDEVEQLNSLVGKYDWFGARSRIIIITKDIQLLDVHEVKALYEVKELNHGQATKLFNWCAFKQNIPKEDFESLSNKVVDYASGLPIALKVLGQFLYGKKISEWESALCQLEKAPRKEIIEVLKVSYDKLENDEKGIFLDIACFFRGSGKDFVSRILGDATESAIRVLHDRCLISISKNEIEMHDLLQRMGWKIVREESPEEPGKMSRLWDFNDIKSIFIRNAGTKTIQGLFVGIHSKIKFTRKAFKKMKKLRLLMVNGSEHHHVQITKDFQFPSYELNYLKWDNYDLESLPTNFYPENLIELSLRKSNIKQLSREIQFDKLKAMDLTSSRHLIAIPNFSSMPKLEILHLNGCESLESLPSDFSKLQFLQELSCRGCLKLKSFPEIKSKMKKLRLLDLSRSSIIEVPSSIGLLKALECLDLSQCIHLASIPRSISNLSSLKTLNLNECPHINEMQVDLEGLQCLEKLKLSCIDCEWGCFSGLRHLQELSLLFGSLKRGVIQSYNCLPSLKILKLWACDVEEGEILNHICHLSSLQELYLGGIRLSRLPAAISRLSNLKILELFDCEQLEEIPELPPNLRLLGACIPPGVPSPLLPLNSLRNCFKSESSSHREILFAVESRYSGPGICIIIPGTRGIPEWVRHKREGSEIEIELPPKWYENNDFMGFVISFLYVPPPHEDIKRSPHLRCQLRICGNNQSQHIDHLEFGYSSEHLLDVLVVFYPKTAIEERYRSGQWTHIKVSMKHILYRQEPNVKECGVHFIDGCCSDSQQNVKRQGKLFLRGNPSSELPTSHHPLQVGSFPSRNLRVLYLNGTTIQELPSSIQHLTRLQSLHLTNSKNLVGLPETICHLKSLMWLSCSGCSKLKAFPEIRENMDKLEVLELDRTAIKELPSSIERLQGLQRLSLLGCNKLVKVPVSICTLSFLRTLIVSFCSKLEELPGRLQCSQYPGAAGLHPNLIQGAIQSDVSYLSSSEAINLSMNPLSSTLPGISQLSKLRILDLSHCQKLLQIPELPSSLRILDAHSCTRLESPLSQLVFSLFECFKSALQELESDSGPRWNKKIDAIIPGSNGIPEWISQQGKGSIIKIHLPSNWYQNNDFLGFALYSVHAPLGNESNEILGVLRCKFNFQGPPFECFDDLLSGQAFCLTYRISCCHNGDESNVLWVAYYPRVAIEEKYHKKKTHLKATFTGNFDGNEVEAEECGIHLIYKPDEIINAANPQYPFLHNPRSWEDAECSKNEECREKPREFDLSLYLRARQYELERKNH